MKFNIIRKENAIEILHDLNYYYKLTVYKKNFKQDEDGKRKNIEFSYMVDIANIDTQLRYILLHFSLDVEQALKTYIITAITENPDTDGFDIVDRFFQSMRDQGKDVSKEKVLERLKNKKHYQYALYQANHEKIAAWVLVEILSFGEFLQFFKYYFEKNTMDEEINSYLSI